MLDAGLSNALQVAVDEADPHHDVKMRRYSKDIQ
jgi:hypothetical protein